MKRTCWYKGKCKLENENCRNNCLRFRNMELLVDNSGIPSDLQYPVIYEPDNLDRNCFEKLLRINDDIENFVSTGNSLYLWSKGCGNGKTTWSCKLLLAYFNRIWVYSQLSCRGIYIYIPSFLNSIKTQFLDNLGMNEYIEKIKNADLAVFDDLGVGKLSDNDISNLLSIIDYRLNSHKSTIFTSNLDLTSLRKTFGDRLYSRICNSSIVVEFNGRDRRGEF